MNAKKILCPIDFSEFNHAANEFASALAQTWDATIVYLAVPDQGTGNGDYEYAMRRTVEREQQKLSEFVPTLPGIKYSHEVKVCSRTAQAIVEYANSHDIDLIVLATHGRTGIRRLFMGSVAEAVVRTASCPVLTIKPDNKEFKEVPDETVEPARNSS